MVKGAARTRLLPRLLGTHAPVATVLIRIAVGVVFASEGIQKFVYPDALGAGRFAKIGIPAPELMGPFVGVVEITCGLLVLGGLLVRFAAFALVVDMLVAIASTKVPILIGHGYFLFSAPAVAEHGVWSMLHESRTDLAMLLGSAFLMLVGAGARSIDARLAAAQRGARRRCCPRQGTPGQFVRLLRAPPRSSFPSRTRAPVGRTRGR